jgi:hypothetical protein
VCCEEQNYSKLFWAVQLETGRNTPQTTPLSARCAQALEIPMKLNLKKYEIFVGWLLFLRPAGQFGVNIAGYLCSRPAFHRYAP